MTRRIASFQEFLNESKAIDAKLSDNYRLFIYFLQERENVRHKKEAGKKWPWTKDEILKNYKFTNISRKHDAFTVLLGQMVKEWMKTEDPVKVIFNILVHRSHSKVDTLKRWGWLSGYADARKKFMKDQRGDTKSMTGSFIRSHSPEDFLNSWKYYDKHAQDLLDHMKKATSLVDVFKELKSYPMVGRFMGWQMLCDLRLFGLIGKMSDDDSFVVLGPGGVSGIALMPKDLQDPIVLLNRVRRDARRLKWMDLEDIEHSLCEFFKYHRCHTGGTEPRQKYAPK